MKTVAKLFFSILLLTGIIMSITSCNETSEDAYIPNRLISATLPPYSNSNLNCNHQMRDVFFHTAIGEQVYACTLCGYTNNGYKYYHNQSSSNTFVRDEKIIIRLSSDYANQELSFRSDVNEVILLGTAGQTLNNLKLVIKNRKNPFTIYFYDVNVISDDNILVSDACAEKIIINSCGSSNSFVTRDGARGTDGNLEYTDYYTAQYATSGSAGSDASDVMVINGNVEIHANAPIKVQGGIGGRGGNGASHKRGPQYVAKNNGGDGGRGGNGGDAICTAGTVTLSGNTSMISLNGGAGGAGGSAGSGGSGIYGSTNGYPGSSGENGKTGLENSTN